MESCGIMAFDIAKSQMRKAVHIPVLTEKGVTG